MRKQLITVAMVIFMALSLMGCNGEHEISETNIAQKAAEAKENKDPFVEIDFFWSSTFGCYVKVVYEVHSGVVYYSFEGKYNSGIAEAHSSKNPNEPMLKEEYIELYGSSKK